MRFCDSDGDPQITVGNAFDRDDELSIGGGYISRAQAGELRDHLSGLLGDGAVATPAGPCNLVADVEYRLLPDATYANGSRLVGYSGHEMEDVTRVRLVRANVDSDGDVRVVALDGKARKGGESWYVHRDFLAPLTEAAPEAKPATSVEVGQEYRLLPGARRANGYRDAFGGEGVIRVRVTDPEDDDGDVRVSALDGRTPGNGDYVLPRYLAPLTDDAPKPAADIAQAARAVAEGHMSTFRLTYGDEAARALGLANAFTQFANLIEGKSL